MTFIALYSIDQAIFCPGYRPYELYELYSSYDPYSTLYGL